jgi:hypothetical protein
MTDLFFARYLMRFKSKFLQKNKRENNILLFLPKGTIKNSFTYEKKECIKNDNFSKQ